MTALGEWENFYVIVGSSAGPLIGLQFVVMTLIADKQVATSEALGSAFGTPNIIHFSAALLLSALVNAPWHGIGAVAVLLGLVGLSGSMYVVIVVRRLRSQTEYNPVFEDWLFHVLLPLAA
jgi:predicted membrane-bound spermidine synthase